MKVREIMTTEPRFAAPDTTLEEIATLMKEEDVGVIPVVDDGEVTGLVTDRDIVVRCIAAGKNPAECTAEDIMSGEVRMIEPDADLDDAADIMAEVQIRRLPVVEDGRLIGMITLGDIAVKAAEEEEQTTAETLEEVSQGVKPSRGGKRASGREEGEEENEMEMTGSASRRPQRGEDPNRSAFREAAEADRARSDRAGSRRNWNQGDREAERSGSDKRRVASAKTWEGGRGQRDRGRVQQTGETRRTSERGRPEKVGHGEQGISTRKAPKGQGISNRAAGRESARQQKVAPKRAEGRTGRGKGRRAS